MNKICNASLLHFMRIVLFYIPNRNKSAKTLDYIWAKLCIHLNDQCTANQHKYAQGKRPRLQRPWLQRLDKNCVHLNEICISVASL